MCSDYSYVPHLRLNGEVIEELIEESPCDYPDCTITILINSKRKKVRLYYGMPQVLIELRELIEEICIEPLMKCIFKRKPGKCPLCNSRRIARILYGMPIFNEEQERQLAAGKIVLGGCEMNHWNPKWQCVDCNAVFFSGEKI